MLKVTDTYCDYKHEPFQDLDLEGAMAFGQVPDMGAEKKMVLKALTDLRNNWECMLHDNLTNKYNLTPYFKHRGFIYEFISWHLILIMILYFCKINKLKKENIYEF